MKRLVVTFGDPDALCAMLSSIDDRDGSHPLAPLATALEGVRRAHDAGSRGSNVGGEAEGRTRR